MPGYFIDTSGLAKLYHGEVGSKQMEMLAQPADNRLIVSQLSVIELQSVFATKVRTGVIDQNEFGSVAWPVFLPTLPLADSRSFWCPVDTLEAQTG